MNKQLLKKLQELYPNRSAEEIKDVISTHLSILYQKLVKGSTLRLKIPHLGTIHTHGNAKNKGQVKRIKLINKIGKKKNMFTDKELLF
jgi:hypothetical protein